MKYIFMILTIFCFFTPLLSQNSVSFSLGADYYDTHTEYRDATGINLRYMKQMTPASQLGLSFNFSSMYFSVTSPSTQKAVEVSSYDLLLVYGYTFSRQLLTLNFKPVAAAGIKVLQRDAFRIDLGALGESTNPQLVRKYFTSYIGLIMSKRISGHLSFFVEPSYSIFNVGQVHSIFSIKGGVDVSFN